MVYYNEFDQFAAKWLRNLIMAGHVSDGLVDERDIREVLPEDVRGFTRVHLFGGIAGWDLALRYAGWPEDRQVWSGSCPCPPFSAAGKKKKCPLCGGRPVPCPRRTGYFICIQCEHAWLADDRHVWPEMWRLIAKCRPPVVFGEQVGGPDGLVWFAGVRASLERIGYSVGAADLPAGSLNAPHVRQRLFWVADLQGERQPQRSKNSRGGYEGVRAEGQWSGPPLDGLSSRLGNAVSQGLQGLRTSLREEPGDGSGWRQTASSGHVGFWDNFDIVPCLDGKTRRVKPGIQLLANGFPQRVGLLRGFGNAIVVQAAAKFIEAFLAVEAEKEKSIAGGLV